MIATLTGRLTRKAVDYLIVDVAGVGYQVFVPLSTFYSIPESGGEVSLHVHTHVREDALTLFGFLTLPEKDMFLLLMSVSGIGPKLALAVLSSLSVVDLSHAIQSSDDTTLCSIPGVGKKTAARMLLELKDKIALLETPVVRDRTATGSGDIDDVVSALVNLGYKKPLAEDAVKKVLNNRPSMTVETLIKESLQALLKR